jgi:hypothetical protein
MDKGFRAGRGKMSAIEIKSNIGFGLGINVRIDPGPS